MESTSVKRWPRDDGRRRARPDSSSHLSIPGVCRESSGQGPVQRRDKQVCDRVARGGGEGQLGPESKTECPVRRRVVEGISLHPVVPAKTCAGKTRTKRETWSPVCWTSWVFLHCSEGSSSDFCGALAAPTQGVPESTALCIHKVRR